MMDINPQDTIHRRLLNIEQALPSITTLEHERRISSMEAEFRHLATKEFVKEQIEKQTETMNPKFDVISDRLKEISERQQRFKGIGQTLIWIFPVVVSAIAVVVAVFR